MISGLGGVRGPGETSQPTPARTPAAAPGAFDAALRQALGAEKRDAAPAAPRPVAADDLLANLEQVTQSLQRASAHISSARAYFRAAQPGASGLNAQG